MLTRVQYEKFLRENSGFVTICTVSGQWAKITLQRGKNSGKYCAVVERPHKQSFAYTYDNISYASVDRIIALARGK